mgnify:CR=1 FL=1
MEVSAKWDRGGERARERRQRRRRSRREREQIVHPSAALSSLASDNRKLSGSPNGTRARKRQRREREREQYEQQGEPRVLCLLELAIAGG